MFGGLAFMVAGNLAVSASSKGGLLLRVDPEQSGALIAEAHVEPFVMRGRSLEGWLRVDVDALDTDDALTGWVRHGVSYARTLAPK